jgi:cardiolipin synthase
MKKDRSRRTKNGFLQPYTLRNTVEWIQSGQKYFNNLENLIENARYEIHLQTYIFDFDNTGSRIAEALIRAAGKKIRVFVLVDAYGSQNIPSEQINRMTEAGIQFRKFGKLYSKGSFHIGRRLHHKICVFDGLTSIIGGINISDNYNDKKDSPPWLDFAVLMKGDISRRLQFVCRRRWIGWQFKPPKTKNLLKNYDTDVKETGNSQIRIRRNDFIRRRNDIAISYREVLRNSEKSILIVGGYFLPGGRTRRLMKKAIERGVEINIVVSENSDVQIVNYARRYLYNWLTRNSIGVFEYKPSNVHGKIIISDEKWSSIGSYDLNNLSTYSNIELNVDINDELFSKNLSAHIREIMQNDCYKIPDKFNYRYKSLFSKFFMWLSYYFVKTLFVLSVLLAGKREKEF